MRFEFVHTFEASRERVIQAMFSPNMPLYLSTHVSLVNAVEPISREEDERQIRRKVKYQPVPVIKKVGPKEVRPEWMHFVEETTFDRSSFRGNFQNVPVTRQIAELLKNSGTLRVEALGPSRSKRVIQGELKVNVFMLGAIAERLIYPHASKIIEEEARALAQYLIENP